MQIAEILNRIAAYEWILIFSLIISIIKKLKGWSIFLSWVVLFELIITYYSAVYLGSNIFVYNLYAIVCITFYITYLLKQIPVKRKILLITLSLFWILISLISLYINRTTNHVNVISYHLGMSIVIYMIITYLKSKLTSDQKWNIYADSVSYFCFGVLVYYSSSFPIITTSNILITNPHASDAFSTLLLIGNIFLSLGYLGTVVCTKKEVLYIG